MAELAIIVAAALTAPALVAVAIAVGRSVGVIPPRRRETRSGPPASPLRSGLLEPARRLGRNKDASEADEPRYCQACGHATAGDAMYCRACGALLDET